MRRTHSLAWGLFFLTLGAAVLPALADKYPEPSKFPIAWELKFKHGIPKRIVVSVPGSGPAAYWYMTYTVTNTSDTDQQFLPLFEMVTNDGKILVSDQAIPLKVFEHIQTAEGDPLLEQSRKIAGTLHIGEDQARDGVAIWREPSTRMGSFDIFAAGLSGEYVLLKDADQKPVLDKDGKQVILRKSFEMSYTINGDELYSDRDEVTPKGERWVMR